MHSGDTHGPASRFIPKWAIDNNFILLFIIFVIGSISVGFESLTGVSYSLWGLALGIFAAWAGILPERALEHANGFSIAMIGLIFIVLDASTKVTIAQILDLLPSVGLIIVAGMTGLMIGGYLGSRLVKWDPLKGMPVALTALFGFPIDYLITYEVARSVGRDEEEEVALLDELLAPMLIGGFTTVTAGSVVIASILVRTL